MLLGQDGANTLYFAGFELAHQLADVLHLAAFALEVADALGVGNRVAQLFGKGQPVHEFRAQHQQVRSQLLYFGALALELGSARFVAAF